MLEIANAGYEAAAPRARGRWTGAEEKLKSRRCGVELDALAMVGREELIAIKEGETSKQKSYEAVCWLPCEVDDEMIASINGAVQRAEERKREKKKEREGAGEGGEKGKVWC